LFRIVNQFVPAPGLFLLCDDPRCGQYVTTQLTVTPATDINHLVELFIQDAQSKGWRVTLAQQLCPGHVKKQQDDAGMVHVPKLYMPN